MAKIRIEWVPVRMFGLGLFGFDHLQLVLQQNATDDESRQDLWFVMEGVRDPHSPHPVLGIQGCDGATTLAAANVAAREDLTAKIGTPMLRGTRILPYGGDAFGAWETMASFARDIEQQHYPYIAYGPAGSPTPTINSSSAIASLIYYSGQDPSRLLPYGMHMSPGSETLLGTSGDDTLGIGQGFTTLLGGEGRDELAGGGGGGKIDKLYGGKGSDLFHWSPGFNIIHGGQPQLAYADDGADIIDYSGAGEVTITYNRHWVAHKVPQYVAVFEGGADFLFSIERIQWNAASDHITMHGAELDEDNAIRHPAGGRDAADAAPGQSNVRSAALVQADAESTPVRSTSDYVLPEGARDLELTGDARAGTGNAADNRIAGNDGDNVLQGLGGGDTFYGGHGNDTLDGGAGDDGYVYMAGDGQDVIIDDGPADDLDELILAGGIAHSGVAVTRPGDAPMDIVLVLDDGGSVRIKDFFAGEGIERVVFDTEPPWSRADLENAAAAAPAAAAASALAADAAGEALHIERSDAAIAFAHADDFGSIAPSSGEDAFSLPLQAFGDWLY
jgi:hypothetical protein